MNMYKGFKYKRMPDGKWIIILPSGFKTVPQNFEDEQEIKDKIDSILTAQEEAS